LFPGRRDGDVEGREEGPEGCCGIVHARRPTRTCGRSQMPGAGSSVAVREGVGLCEKRTRVLDSKLVGKVVVCLERGHVALEATVLACRITGETARSGEGEGERAGQQECQIW
jgi:hypothetical protein